MGYGFKTSLSLDAKDHNGGRVLCPAYKGLLLIHVDEMMVDQEIVHLVDYANLLCREGLNCLILAWFQVIQKNAMQSLDLSICALYENVTL